MENAEFSALNEQKITIKLHGYASSFPLSLLEKTFLVLFLYLNNKVRN